MDQRNGSGDLRPDDGAVDKRAIADNAGHEHDTPAEIAAPVAQRERIVSIDALRGFALLGILVMNIRFFAGPFSSYSNPFAYEAAGGEQTRNWLVFAIGHVLADMKMMSIFSMLFGAGVVIMSERQQAKGLGKAGVHYRRMFWLLIFGLVHAYLIWAGDILVPYAICGALVFLVRRLPVPFLFALSAVLLAIGIALSVGFGLSIEYWPDDQLAEMRESMNPTLETLNDEVASYRGSWLDQMEHRVPTSIAWQTGGMVFFGFWRISSMMLLGMALYRLGVFSAARSKRCYVWMAVLGFGIGVPLILWGLQRNLNDGFVFETAFLLNSQFNYIGSIFVALGWVGFVMLLIRSGALEMLMGALAAVGQMALTNYLMQSIICTTIFYGHGLGFFGELDYLQQFYVVLAVWAAELVWSPLWLKSFRFGPFEWLWRSLTYWRPQPMRRA